MHALGGGDGYFNFLALQSQLEGTENRHLEPKDRGR